MIRLLMVSLTFIASLCALADETTPSLHGFLMNSREVRRLLERKILPKTQPRERSQGGLVFWPDTSIAGQGGTVEEGLFDISGLTEKDDLCRALQLGCLLVNYTDKPSETLLFTVEPSPENYAEKGLHELRPRELSLLGLNAGYGNHYSRMRGDVKDGVRRLTSELRYSSYSDIEQDDLQKLKEFTSKTKRPDSLTFKYFMAMHPRLFGRLPNEFTRSLTRDQKLGVGYSEQTQLLEETLTTMLLLSLDALTKVADSQSLFYPYFHDRLVLPRTLIGMDRLYRELHELKDERGESRWPKIRHLTDSDRDHFDAVFQEKENDSYLADGIYEPETNTIYIDLTRPFFESAFTLYHELWHVKAYHSPQVKEYAAHVQTLLKLPESPESRLILGQTLVKFFAEHELLALDQSARLYRAVGHLVNQWGPIITSEKGWHDSAFGGLPISDLYIPANIRTLSDGPVKPHLISRILIAPAIPETLILAGRRAYRDHLLNKAIEKRDQQIKTLDQYLATRLPHHLENYRMRYFKDLESFDLPSIQADLKILPAAVEIPTVVALSCSDVVRVGQALGGTSQYGLPFPYKVTGGWESCPQLHGGLLAKSFRLKVRTGLPNLRGPRLKGAEKQ